MPPYNTGEASRYYGDDQQHEDYFDPYDTRHQHDQGHEPYQDEPSNTMSHGNSTEPLNQNKEQPSVYPDAFTATPRPGGCVLRLPAQPVFGTPTLLLT